ncbi:MAG: glycosyltransferase [Selenomonadales bacterium]|nr:glycosyltransferase [Selenomonadales bacterium]
MARFLLCHAPFGSGHTVAKEAIEEAISKNHSDAECISINVFSYLPTWIEKGILKSYLWILAHCPSIYRRGYRLSNRQQGSAILMRLISPLMKARLMAAVRAYRPDAVICTHATPTVLAGDLAERGLLRAPIFAVVTDYVVHRLWMHGGVSRYFVAHKELIDRFRACSFSGDNVTVSGIPVRARFCPREDIREEGRVLVMGGGLGLMNLMPILRAMSRMRLPVTLHIITGSETGRKRALAMTRNYSYEIIVDGYSRCVDEAMRRASVLITKAGGVSVAEALAIGVPLILFGSLAGQEEGNTAFLAGEGAALTANDEEELYRSLRRLLARTDDSWAKMAAAQEKLRRPYAAQMIAEEIWKMIKQ